MNIRNFLSNLSFVVLSLNFARMFRISVPIVVVNEKSNKWHRRNAVSLQSSKKSGKSIYHRRLGRQFENYKKD